MKMLVHGSRPSNNSGPDYSCPFINSMNENFFKATEFYFNSTHVSFALCLTVFFQSPCMTKYRMVTIEGIWTRKSHISMDVAGYDYRRGHVGCLLIQSLLSCWVKG